MGGGGGAGGGIAVIDLSTEDTALRSYLQYQAKNGDAVLAVVVILWLAFTSVNG